MKLIVESGSTKSKWILLDNRKVIDEQLLPGINATSNPQSVALVSEYTQLKSIQIEEIYFYGAGVSSDDARAKLLQSLQAKFGEVKIEMLHDILAAARAMSDGNRSITSILGTGTNTVVFDGNKIVDSRKALGFLMADFGSGFHIGKILIWKYYNYLMNSEDVALFKKRYITEGKDFIYSLYTSDKPNFEIASLSRFLESCSTDLRSEVLDEAFTSFVKNQIRPLQGHADLPLHFVGSISEVFKEELQSVLKREGLILGDINGDPSPGLIAYHSK